VLISLCDRWGYFDKHMNLKSHIMGNSCNLKSACVQLISVFSLCDLVSQKSRFTQASGWKQQKFSMCWCYVPLSFQSILSQNVIYLFLNITLFIVQYYYRNVNKNTYNIQNAQDSINVSWNPWHAFEEPLGSEEITLKNTVL